MARHQPFDFSDDDDLAVASGGANLHDAEFSESGSAGIHGMSEGIGSDDLAATQQTGAKSGKAVQQATQKSQTATRARTSTDENVTPTAMERKRGNQPR